MMNRAILLLVLCSSVSLSQYSIEVRFVGDAARTTTIGAFERGGVWYGSLVDLAAAFRLGTYTNPNVQKIELKSDKHTIKLTAGNRFVIITDRHSNANIHQLPVHILFAAGTYFAPLESFVPLLDALVPEEVVFNKRMRLVAVGTVLPTPRFDVAGLSIEERANGNLIRIRLNKEVKDYETWLKPVEKGGKTGIHDDYWLYVTLADVRADTAALNATKPAGAVRKVLAFQSPTSVQLTFRLRGHISSTEMMQDAKSRDLLLALHMPTTEQLAARRHREIERNLERERERWKLDVIVLDPGHGGKDPGTIGVSGVKEKDITLALARRLGRLIEKELPGVKVVYTRTTDEFVELYRRGQIANQAGGKLFVSIHCNSMPRKPHPMNGFEIYLLRPGKTEHALRIAERENAVVKFEEGYEQRYQELTEENFILLTMAQSAYMRFSEQFAEILQEEMETHSGLQNQGVKQAGFYVLVGASMPNVLFEVGYLSNRHDERILTSNAGQQQIVQSMFNAIHRYKQEYERSFRERRSLGATE